MEGNKHWSNNDPCLNPADFQSGILDIQSWYEVPSIAHFCSLFRAAFSLVDFDIEVC